MTTTETQPASFRSPEEVTVGTVVFDRDADMVAVGREVKGLMVDLERPTGLIWGVAYARLRPGTKREERQLQALAKLQRARKRGMP
ncbi:hypothetical protein SLV14_001442 [Streptomyces sp. Je 1-4]|uniref:hypothetical protein n=1 Tax=Streptomyces TaxID=1883 RepID=UPI00140EF5F5|nr:MULTISPECIES: hypothetical protein [unclassified Streptomyces]QIK05758.1 hypothetical protein G7Z12_06610 [Streptomyces sp. ID38640]UYB39012.1 hypothetical protein SLV14_001442 [Streptomyces sp. Je 1-4]UZQ35012.1 hypothetical protein SLV14N_001442 [Streptomyces sp. Je 1-4] [Streptomyces sp. Je 1-4 4N24]UZQ42430.1 hypothetical protein SLV14NA_001442 [Streptomyces sp. Je 1-4] [Streptomyces sp. Je 1-4 4N24_ara]